MVAALGQGEVIGLTVQNGRIHILDLAQVKLFGRNRDQLPLPVWFLEIKVISTIHLDKGPVKAESSFRTQDFGEGMKWRVE